MELRTFNVLLWDAPWIQVKAPDPEFARVIAYHRLVREGYVPKRYNSSITTEARTWHIPY